jgi:hypothetical protein
MRTDRTLPALEIAIERLERDKRVHVLAATPSV